MPLVIESLHTGPVCDQANSLTDVTTASVFPQNVPLYDSVCFMKCTAPFCYNSLFPPLRSMFKTVFIPLLRFRFFVFTYYFLVTRLHDV